MLNKTCAVRKKLKSHLSPSLLPKLAPLEENLANEIDLAKADYASYLTVHPLMPTTGSNYVNTSTL